MEENVALDSSKQKNFVKSVKGIKKLLKKNNKKPGELKPAIKDEKSAEVKRDGKVTKKRKKRGLVYLSHIPHGFYEQQMTEYFKQFGVVTNARVIRSRRTGNSKGFAFVEFKEPAVAEIVAETMNNYLMGKRLIKAAYIPPNKQKAYALRKKWNTLKNPSSDERLMFRKLNNAEKTEAQELKMARKLLLNLSKTKEKLSNLGILYDFFKPVDVPEVLIDKIDEVISQTDIKLKKQVKHEKNELKSEETMKPIKAEQEDVNAGMKTDKTKKKQQKQKQMENTVKSDSNETFIQQATLKTQKGKFQDKSKPNNKDEKNQIKKSINKTQQKNKDEESQIKKTINKTQQKNKEEKLKKVPENFISIKESVDSDSSINFDSDEFEKMIELENNDDESSSDDNNESKDEKIQKFTKIQHKWTASGVKNKSKNKTDIGAPKKQGKRSIQSQSEVKRGKTDSGAPVANKKAKFEKQLNNKPLNKVVKRRK